jgi:hypothetical protein
MREANRDRQLRVERETEWKEVERKSTHNDHCSSFPYGSRPHLYKEERTSDKASSGPAHDGTRSEGGKYVQSSYMKGGFWTLGSSWYFVTSEEPPEEGRYLVRSRPRTGNSTSVSALSQKRLSREKGTQERKAQRLGNDGRKVGGGKRRGRVGKDRPILGRKALEMDEQDGGESRELKGLGRRPRLLAFRAVPRAPQRGVTGSDRDAEMKEKIKESEGEANEPSVPFLHDFFGSELVEALAERDSALETRSRNG